MKWTWHSGGEVRIGCTVCPILDVAARVDIEGPAWNWAIWRRNVFQIPWNYWVNCANVISSRWCSSPKRVIDVRIFAWSQSKNMVMMVASSWTFPQRENAVNNFPAYSVSCCTDFCRMFWSAATAYLMKLGLGRLRRNNWISSCQKVIPPAPLPFFIDMSWVLALQMR